MSRTPVRRPTLLPALRRMWRDPNRLQLGTDPARAVVLEFADPAYARILDLLDGSLTEAGVLRAAARQGIGAEEATAVLTVLRQAGLVVDAHTLRTPGIPEATRRRLGSETAAIALRQTSPGVDAATSIRRRLAAQVLITGSSLLAVPIASMLAAAGVGHLNPDVSGTARLSDSALGGLLPTDAYRPRGQAAAEAIRRAAPEVDIAPLRPARATFAVLVGFAAPATLTALSYGRRRLAHLAVSVRDATVVVGPLVRPGESPCLNCLDLHRLDRDPGWRAVAAQLTTAPETPEPVAATTALAAAAYAAAEVLTHIDGGTPQTLGSTVEIAGPGDSCRRRWTVHPSCGCRRRVRSRPAEPLGGPT